MRFIFSQPNHVELRRLFLAAADHSSEVGASERSPILYYATSTGSLKQSSQQTKDTSQDMNIGKFRPQHLGGNVKTTAKWSAIAEGEPVVLELVPPHGAGVFPKIGQVQFIFSNQNARRPSKFVIEAKPQGSQGWVDVPFKWSGNQVDLSANISLFKPTDKFLHALRGANQEQVRQALNRMPSRLHGCHIDPESLSTVLETAVQTDSPQVFALVLSNIESNALYGQLGGVLFKRFAEGHPAATDLIRRLANCSPEASLAQYRNAFKLGSTELVDLLHNLCPSVLPTYGEELVRASLSCSYEYVLHVVNKLKDALEPPEKRQSHASLPAIPMFSNPSPATLLSAYRCSDQRVFHQLFSVASHDALRAFLAELQKSEPAGVSLETMKESLQRGVSLRSAILTGSNFLDLALEKGSAELATLLLETGLRCHDGNPAALQRAFDTRNSFVFNLLVAHGASAPLFYFFSRLVSQKDASDESIDQALNLLFSPGRLSPDTIIPGTGESLLQSALKQDNVVLASRLAQRGAPLPPPTTPSIFTKAFQDKADVRTLAAALYFKSDGDADSISPAFVTFLGDRPANSLDYVNQFLKAGADANAEYEGKTALLAAANSPTFEVAVLARLLEAGANPAAGSSLVLSVVPKRFESLLFSDYEYLVSIDPKIDYAELLFRMMDSSSSVMKSLVGRQIVAHALSHRPDLNAHFPFFVPAERVTLKRFGGLSSSPSWGYSGSPDGISFTVNKPVWLYGYGAVGGESGTYTARIELRDGDNTTSSPVLRETDVSFTSSDTSILPVLFSEPIQLDANHLYTAVINYSSTLRTYSGSDGNSVCSIGDITFSFQGASSSTNGTSTTGGQLHHFIIKSAEFSDTPQTLPLLAICCLTQKSHELFDRLYEAGSRIELPATADKTINRLIERAFNEVLKTSNPAVPLLAFITPQRVAPSSLIKVVSSLPPSAAPHIPATINAYLESLAASSSISFKELLGQTIQSHPDVLNNPVGKVLVEFSLARASDLGEVALHANPDESVCSRFSSLSSSPGWGYSGSPDAVAFTVNKSIWLTGYGVVGGRSGEYAVTLEVRRGRHSTSSPVIASASRTFSSSSTKIVQLSFDEPVEITEGTAYCAVVKYTSTINTYSGQSGSSTVTVDDVTFSFSGADGSTNGTSTSSGQLHRFYFTQACFGGSAAKTDDAPTNTFPLLALAALTQKTPDLFQRLYDAGSRISAQSGLSAEAEKLRVKMLDKAFKKLVTAKSGNPVVAFDTFLNPSAVNPTEFLKLCLTLPSETSEHLPALIQKYFEETTEKDPSSILNQLMQKEPKLTDSEPGRAMVERCFEKQPNPLAHFPFGMAGGDEVSEVSRFESMSSSTNWGYSGSPDAITFKVNRAIAISGFAAVGGGSSEYRVTIELRKGTSSSDPLIVAATRTFTSSTNALVPLMFDSPIEIAAEENYVAVVRYDSSSSSTYSGNNGRSTVTVGDITFSFSTSGDSNNGTSTSSGQIHKIFFEEFASISSSEQEHLPLVAIAALTQKSGNIFDRLLTALPTATAPSVEVSEASLLRKSAYLRRAFVMALRNYPLSRFFELLSVFEGLQPGVERSQYLAMVLGSSPKSLFKDTPITEVAEILCTLLDVEDLDTSCGTPSGDMLSLALRNAYPPIVIQVLLRCGASISSSEDFVQKSGNTVGPLLNLAFDRYADAHPDWLLEIAESLVSSGASVNQHHSNHFPTPHFVSVRVKAKDSRRSAAEKFITFLLDHGLDINLPLKNYQELEASAKASYGVTVTGETTPFTLASGAYRKFIQTNGGHA